MSLRIHCLKTSLRSFFMWNTSTTRMEQLKRLVADTFDGGRQEGEVFEKKLGNVISAMNNITAEDVRLDYEYLMPQGPEHAPVTYVDIWDHPHFTINMFILRPGSKLPLHNHPKMHGILKVIEGKVKIRSFNIDPDLKLSRLKKILAVAEPEKIVTKLSHSILLTPTKGNIHEIKALDGGAAFVDVLAPPYQINADGQGARSCRYFVETRPVDSNNVVEFLVLDRTPDYWTDIAPYLGP